MFQGLHLVKQILLALEHHGLGFGSFIKLLEVWRDIFLVFNRMKVLQGQRLAHGELSLERGHVVVQILKHFSLLHNRFAWLVLALLAFLFCAFLGNERTRLLVERRVVQEG